MWLLSTSLLAHPKGFEPLTPTSAKLCSIQLSYGCVNENRRHKLMSRLLSSKTNVILVY